MELVTGRAGTPHITSQQDRQRNQGTFGDGAYILKTGNQLAPVVQSSNKIQIKDGALMFQGALFSVKVGTVDEVTIANGSQGMQRKDLIVARYTYDAGENVESAAWAVIQGTPAASNPVTPEYTEGDIQAGDTTVECPVFIVTLDGINITGVEMVPEIAPDVPEIMAQLEELNSKMPVCFGSADADVITVTAPYDCKIVVDFSCLGWGTDGAYLEFTIDGDESVKKEYEHTGGCEGRNTEYMPLTASACFSGLRKGQQYSFARSNIYGTFGMSWNRRWSAWCIPE